MPPSPSVARALLSLRCEGRFAFLAAQRCFQVGKELYKQSFQCHFFIFHIIRACENLLCRDLYPPPDTPPTCLQNTPMTKQL